MTESLYRSWNSKAREIARGNISHWKQCREVVEMLEHVRVNHAQVFLQMCLDRGLTVDQIQEYATRVDSIGNARVLSFHANGHEVRASPTCLRYLYHALCIMETYQNSGLPVVEIGGGYGGLVIAIQSVAKLQQISIPKYTIVDLPDVQLLQKFYIHQFSPEFPVEFASNFHEPSFLISNYALAEMAEWFRKSYMTMIKDHASKGFLVWNSSASYQDLETTFQLQIETENPQTGKINKVIRFQRV